MLHPVIKFGCSTPGALPGQRTSEAPKGPERLQINNAPQAFGIRVSDFYIDSRLRPPLR